MVRLVAVLSILALALAACGGTAASSRTSGHGASPGMMGTGSMGSGHAGKPNMTLPTKQVAPAATAMLMPVSMACGKKVTGSGSVKMIPVHVGKMTGPHVTLLLTLHGARPGEELGISGIFTGAHSWRGMAETDKVDMMGKLHVMTRLMPMLRPGQYKAKIMLHDESCSGGMPLAYVTPETPVVLR